MGYKLWQESGRSILSIAIYLALYLVSISVFSLIAYGIHSIGLVSNNTLTFILEVVSLLSLSVAVFLYGKLYKKESLKQTLSFLGLSKDRISVNALWIGILLFIIILLLEVAVGSLGNFLNTSINTNTGTLFAGAPLWFYVFVAVIEPVNEEIFFRGFLIKRINIGTGAIGSSLLKRSYRPVWAGIVASAVIFGLLHASYDSTFAIEVVAAMFFGLMAGYVFSESDSLYPSMLTHILVNSLGVLAILSIILIH